MDAVTGKVVSWEMPQVTVNRMAQCLRHVSAIFTEAETIYLVWDNWLVHVLKEYLKLLEQEAEANKKIREAQIALEKKVLDKYKALGVDEIKTLVVEDKWLAKLENDVQTEMHRVSQRLTARIKELAERYQSTLPSLTTEVSDLEKKIHAHLGKMGFAWK